MVELTLDLETEFLGEENLLFGDGNVLELLVLMGGKNWSS